MPKKTPKLAALLRTLALWLLLLAAPLAALSFANSGPPELVWPHAPGWSRARLVTATAVSQPAPIVITGSGEIFLFVFRPVAGGAQPTLVALDRRTEVQWEQALAASFERPAQPRLLWDGSVLHLFWLAGDSLYGAQITPDGAVLVAPQQLSGAIEVAYYAAAVAPAMPPAVWYSGTRREPGLYALTAGPSAAQISATGFAPGLQFDARGRLHAVWLATDNADPDRDNLLYAQPADETSPTAGQQIATVDLDPRDKNLVETVFALDGEYGYLFWTITSRPQQEVRRTLSQYLSFALAAPTGASAASGITFPRGADLAYGTDGRVAFEASSGSVVTDFAPVTPTQPELVVAGQAAVRYKFNRTVYQVGVAYWQAGAPASYQLVSYTGSGSFQPALAAGPAGQLYLSWIEPAERNFNVYFTATDPQISAALAPLRGADIARISLAVVFGMLLGALFAPFAAALWLAAPLVGLAATARLRRSSEHMSDWPILLSLLLALGGYWAVKLATFGTAYAYVPFAAWLPPLDPFIIPLLRLGVPLLITAGGLLAALLVQRRRFTPSVFVFVVVYAAVDSLLTMAIYGGVLTGEFYPFA